MTHDRSVTPSGSGPAFPFSRRRLVASAGAAVAVSAVWPVGPARGRQDPTPAGSDTDSARIAPFITLSRSLCGGGAFDQGMAAQLLGWMNEDRQLREGLATLLAEPDAIPTPLAGGKASAETEAATLAADAILLYWYTGYFKGKPIPDRGLAYTRLVAWQAMYTPPFAECKEFGGWADPPNTEPIILGL
ncbi:MAG: sugar dehydrogenase complex small subunit [Thermomicrobiales bacterium]